ncbi:MAG: triose-phosphate isomerase, partial [Planctomycetaceae bacterium]
MRTFLIAGNWKMNTTLDSARALARAVASGGTSAAVEVLVCPPFPYLLPVREALAGSRVLLGAQDAYFEPPGAFTGEVAMTMLRDIGCEYVILGHSERRHVLGEPDGLINNKTRAALAEGLTVILCVGETLAEREADRTEQVLQTQMAGGLDEIDAAQMAGIVIAYEPVWAIGTGRTATPQQAQDAHRFLRGWLADRFGKPCGDRTRILYGGSVKPDNARDLLAQADVDG